MTPNSRKTKFLTTIAICLACASAAQAAWLGPKRAYGFKSTSARSAPIPTSLHIHVSHPANCGIAYRQRPVSRIHTAYAPSRRLGLRSAGFRSSTWRSSLDSISRLSYRSPWRYGAARTTRLNSQNLTCGYPLLTRVSRPIDNTRRDYLYLPDVQPASHSPQVVVNNHYYGRRPFTNRRDYNPWNTRSRQSWHDRIHRDRRFDNMPRPHIVQILGVIADDIPSSFDLPPASLERNAEILDLPAWKQLHAGQSAAAYAGFKSLAPDAANSSAAMIGYAIAAAEEKKFHVAGFALRQAYENDPEGAASMTLTFDLQKRVKKLAQRAAIVARQYGDDYADARFLHAAFSALALDDHVARQSIDKAISAGDRSESAQNLRDAVALEFDSPMLAGWDAL